LKVSTSAGEPADDANARLSVLQAKIARCRAPACRAFRPIRARGPTVIRVAERSTNRMTCVKGGDAWRLSS